MADYMITSDTSCDFPLEYVQQHQLPVVSLFYSIDGVSGSNGCPSSEELKTFYDKMRQGAQTKTQQASKIPKQSFGRSCSRARTFCTSHFLLA